MTSLVLVASTAVAMAEARAGEADAGPTDAAPAADALDAGVPEPALAPPPPAPPPLAPPAPRPSSTAAITRDDDDDDDGGPDSPFADLSLEELMEVDVATASYVMPSRLRQPVSLTTISREQIELSGARTLLELLTTYVPGFFRVEDQDDVIAGFRGYSPDNNSKVLLLVDGHAMNTEWFMGPSGAILAGIDLELIDHVDVIRGPGSVTLGQGALLGVINVVTRTGSDERGALATVTVGPYGDRRASVLAGFGGKHRLTGNLYLAYAGYDGQRPDDAGWQAVQENPPGVSVFDRGHRLQAADSLVVRSQLSMGDLGLDFLALDGVRDAYEFYRDREVAAQRLTSVTLWWRPELADGWRLSLAGSLDRDDFGWRSHEGGVMAGVREERASLVASVVGRQWQPGNTLAGGVELAWFRLGLPDRDGDNFIINDEADRGLANNQRNTYVNRDRFGTVGVFVEDSQHLDAADVDLFAGLRLDVHPYWGTAFTPRLGAIWSAAPALQLRLSLQSGFRGAPGVHYTGGFRGDGLLREASFDQVTSNPFAAAAGLDNLAATRPERLYGLEAGALWRPREGTAVEAVAYVNVMDHVIDVGVIYFGDDPAFVAAPADQRTIGDDPVGDWNGWFYFKNNPGRLTSAGGELSASTRLGWAELAGSTSITRLVDVPAAQAGSMYVSGRAGDPHFKAYPELVTRLRLTARPLPGLVAAVGLLWYGDWYSPAWQSGAADGEGAVVVDVVASYRIGKVELVATLKNALDAAPLWPMNSNVADAAVSPGSPALEHVTGWLTLRVGL